MLDHLIDFGGSSSNERINTYLQILQTDILSFTMQSWVVIQLEVYCGTGPALTYGKIVFKQTKPNAFSISEQVWAAELKITTSIGAPHENAKFAHLLHQHPSLKEAEMHCWSWLTLLQCHTLPRACNNNKSRCCTGRRRRVLWSLHFAALGFTESRDLEQKWIVQGYFRGNNAGISFQPNTTKVYCFGRTHLTHERWTCLSLLDCIENAEVPRALDLTKRIWLHGGFAAPWLLLHAHICC